MSRHFSSATRAAFTATLIGGFTLVTGSIAHAATLSLKVNPVPEDGLVVQSVSLGAVRDEIGSHPIARMSAIVTVDGQRIPTQIIPNVGFGEDNYEATLVLSAKGRKSLNGSLALEWDGAPAKPIEQPTEISTGAAIWTFDPKLKGIFPGSLTFKGSGRTLQSFSWNDRLIDRKINAFSLYDARPESLEIVADGSIATVVRGQARYRDGDGHDAPGSPRASYDWYFFKNSPLVFVNARQSSRQAYQWKESHFLEWLFKNPPFKNALGDAKTVPLEDKGADHRFEKWSALSGDGMAVAALAGPALIYDAPSTYGAYIHVASPEPWAGWDGLSRPMRAWLWAGETATPEAVIAADSANRDVKIELSANLDTVSTRLAALRAAANRLPEGTRRRRLWFIDLAQRAVQGGRLSAAQLPAGGLTTLPLPDEWHVVTSGNLGMVVEVLPRGMKLISLYDLPRRRELLATQTLPLFTLQTRTADPSDETSQLFGAAENWDDCGFEKTATGFAVHFRRGAANAPVMAVTVTADANTQASAWEWNIVAENKKADFAINNVSFPQITLASPGPSAKTFYPRAAGVVNSDSFDSPFRATATYPSGYGTMQFMAAYSDTPGGSGLYVARHDPRAAIKDIQMATDLATHGVQITFHQPAENGLSPGNGYKMTGTGVWQLLHGDWYDASQIYKKWVQAKANWWPEITDDGRPDTPLWYKQLDVWACLQLQPEKVRAEAERMRAFLEVPLGVHWYHWEASGVFDNDYPHFLPSRTGFKETVDALQKQGIHIMPYTNGRLWDTRDRGMEDWQFTAKARPHAVKEYKNGKLELDVSSYNAREKDGSKTVLATMCPTSPFWQDTIAELTRKLTFEEGVDAVYLDQITVSVPIPCMDPAHGHPLGGGHWWVDGYHKMLDKVRKTSRPGTIFTSEAMAEPYMKYFDGYLTYSTSSNGQVPAFSAIYGGAIQLFGREYDMGPDGDTTDSLRMKAGQELVYGEQIGWLTDDILFNKTDEASRQYYKQVVQVRHKIQPYIYAGEMRRPPQLNGAVPTITADWGPSSTPEWSKAGAVTTDAVLTGAWKKRGADRFALIFTNVSNQAVNSSFTLKPAQYGVSSKHYRVSKWMYGGDKATVTTESGNKTHPISIPARSTLVWEVSAAPN